MEAFLDNSGQQLVDLLHGQNGTQPKQEIKIPLHQMEAVVSLFYSAIRDVYIGVDSHPPSRFLQVHPFLLGNLIASETTDDGPQTFFGQHEECHAPRRVRIIPISPEALQADFDENPELVQRYFDEHVKGAVKLLCVDPKKKDAIHYAVLRGEWTGDLGLWVNTCALLFEGDIKPSNSQLRLELVYPHDSRFQNYVSYVGSLIQQAELVSLQNGEVKTSSFPAELRDHLLWSLDAMFQPALADVWDKFVSPQKRVSKLGPFVEERLAEMGAKQATILDAATGVGCDSLYLASKGHNVTSNEIDARLISHAMELAEKGDQTLDITRFDWRHFEHLAERETFDMVLALGNSLSCLRSESDVRAVLARFAYLLRPNGLLILDERNYPAMWAQQEQMTKPDFRFPGRVIYCSNTIRARPQKMPELPGIDNEILRLEYRRSRDNEPVGTFDVLPFADGQLERLLEESGFRSIRAYYNLSAKGKPENAQFVTYVASRTYDSSEFAQGEDVNVVVAFTDISGSTEAKKRLGERVYAQEWGTHEKHVRKVLKRSSGRIVNSTGDGFLLAFDSAATAIECVSGIVRNPGTTRLVVRAGITIGTAMEDRGGNLRGRDVDVAARICDRAKPDLVVVDDRLRLEAQTQAQTYSWEQLGRLELRGAGEWDLWQLA